MYLVGLIEVDGLFVVYDKNFKVKKYIFKIFIVFSLNDNFLVEKLVFII